MGDGSLALGEEEELHHVLMDQQVPSHSAASLVGLDGQTALCWLC